MAPEAERGAQAIRLGIGVWVRVQARGCQRRESYAHWQYRIMFFGSRKCATIGTLPSSEGVGSMLDMSPSGPSRPGARLGARPGPRPGDLGQPRSGSVPATLGEVFALIRSGEVSTRSQVGRATGLSRTAVASRLSALLGSGLVVEDAGGGPAEGEPSGGGRPPIRLRFNRDAGGSCSPAPSAGSRTQLAVCDLMGAVLASSDLEQEVGPGPDELMPQVVACLSGLLEEVGRPTSRVRAVGLSIPGTARLRARGQPGLADHAGVGRRGAGADLREFGKAPVFVDNDADVMALSERRGHLERYRDLVLVKASTGIGAGIVSHGELLRGALGAAGELGHTKTPAAEGLTCRCGDTGCVPRQSREVGRWCRRCANAVVRWATSGTSQRWPPAGTPRRGTWWGERAAAG